MDSFSHFFKGSIHWTKRQSHHLSSSSGGFVLVYEGTGDLTRRLDQFQRYSDNLWTANHQQKQSSASISLSPDPTLHSPTSSPLSLSLCLWLWICDICDISADVVPALSSLGPIFADIMTLCSSAAVEPTHQYPAPTPQTPPLVWYVPHKSLVRKIKKGSVRERVNCK